MKIFRCLIVLSLVLVILLVVHGSYRVDAANVVWDGDTNDDWHNGSNWQCVVGPFCVPAPPSPPDAAILSDTTFGSAVNFSDHVSMDRIEISGGIQLNASGFRLRSNRVTLDGAFSRLQLLRAERIFDSSSEIGRLVVDNGGSVQLGGLGQDPANPLVESIFINPGGALQGNGTLDVKYGGDFFGVLRPLNGDLIIDPELTVLDSSLRFAGIIDADDGDFISTDVALRVDYSSPDPDFAFDFAGLMQIGTGDRVSFGERLRFGGAQARLEMIGRSGVATLGGSAVEFVDSNTRIEVQSGTGRFSASTEFNEGIMTTANSATVHLVNEAVFGSGFSFQPGAGYKLVVDGETSISQPTFDWDSTGPGTHTTTVNPGGSLHISSDSINPGDNTFRGLVVLNGALLSVQTDSPWVLSGQMQMNHVPEEVATLSGGPVTVGNGVDLGNDSRIQVTGAGTSAIGAVASFRSDAEIEIEPASTLLITTTATYAAGVEITGGGTLTGLGKSTFDDGISIAASLVNRGTLEIVDGGLGTLTVDSFVQTGPLSELVIDLLSTQANDLDRLEVVGEANLGGTLSVAWIGSGSPTSGDQFEVLTASSVVGEFDNHNLPALPSDLSWFVDYNPTSVLLRVIESTSSDFDNDGDVDGTDFLFIQRNNQSLIPLWQSQYGASPLAAGVAVPEPTSVLLGIFCVMVTTSVSRNRSGTTLG